MILHTHLPHIYSQTISPQLDLHQFQISEFITTSFDAPQ